MSENLDNINLNNDTENIEDKKNIEDIIFENYKRDITNCRINAIKDFKQFSEVEKNPTLMFRFDNYLGYLDKTYVNYTKVLEKINWKISEKYIEYLKKEFLLINLWYNSILNKAKNEKEKEG